MWEKPVSDRYFHLSNLVGQKDFHLPKRNFHLPNGSLVGAFRHPEGLGKLLWLESKLEMSEFFTLLTFCLVSFAFLFLFSLVFLVILSSNITFTLCHNYPLWFYEFFTFDILSLLSFIICCFSWIAQIFLIIWLLFFSSVEEKLQFTDFPGYLTHSQ